MIRRMRTAGLAPFAIVLLAPRNHVPTLMKDVNEMVARDRAARTRHTTAGN
jgi:hypothetical protein